MRLQNFIEVYTGIFQSGKQLYLRKSYPGRVRKGGHVVVDHDSDHYALEAWERMTTAGVQVTRNRAEFAFGKDICEALVNGEEQGMFLAAR